MSPHKAPRVAVFTLTYNREEYTRRMLESIAGSTDLDYDHFIVDNGSTDGTRALLESNPAHVVSVQFNAQNRGISLASNQALDAIGDGYDYIVKLDNDCLLSTPGWLESLIGVCRAENDRIVLSPYIRGLEGGQFEGGYPRTGQAVIAGHPVGLTRHLGGICVLAPAAAYSGFRFRTDVPKHGNQDVLFSIHVRRRLGMRMGYVEDVAADNIEGVLQYLRYPEYFTERQSERRAVYGERSVFTRLATPFRKIRLIRAMRKAGLSDRTVFSAAVDKLRRVNGIEHKREWENGGEEWT